MADPLELQKNLDNLRARIRQLQYDMRLDRKAGAPEDAFSGTKAKIKNLQDLLKGGGGEQHDSQNDIKSYLLARERPRDVSPQQQTAQRWKDVYSPEIAKRELKKVHAGGNWALIKQWEDTYRESFGDARGRKMFLNDFATALDAPKIDPDVKRPWNAQDWEGPPKPIDENKPSYTLPRKPTGI